MIGETTYKITVSRADSDVIKNLVDILENCKLYDLLVFSMEPDDLNEQLKELESEDPKTCTFIYRFIKTKLNK